MKIEFLAGDRDPMPLVQMFDFQPGELEKLIRACDRLADGLLREFAVHEQPWVRPIDECHFYWRASEDDVGVNLPTPEQPFVLEYSSQGWREVAGKLFPFVDARPGTYNWLTNEGDVNVLISTDGKW